MTTIYKIGDQQIRPGRGFTDANGIRHPGNWNIWSSEEKKAAGISEIVMQPFPDQRLYNSSYNSDGSVTSTAKKLGDTNVVDNGKTIVIAGVKTSLKNEVKRQQGNLLFQTDWAIVRKADAGTAIPTNIQTWRDAIRAKATEMETAIDNAADTDAIAALFVDYDSDGKKSGILYDWPELD